MVTDVSIDPAGNVWVSNNWQDIDAALGQVAEPRSTLGAGQGVTEFDPRSQAAAEIALLWSAIDRSVKAIHGLYRSAGAMHRVAA